MKKFVWAILLTGVTTLTGFVRADEAAEVVEALKSRYVDNDKLDQKTLSRKPRVAGLLKALGAGAQLLSAQEAAAKAPGIEPNKSGEPLARAEIIDPNIGYIRLADVVTGTEAALDG